MTDFTLYVDGEKIGFLQLPDAGTGLPLIGSHERPIMAVSKDRRANLIYVHLPSEKNERPKI